MGRVLASGSPYSAASGYLMTERDADCACVGDAPPTASGALTVVFYFWTEALTGHPIASLSSWVVDVNA